jgi:hypothetical protein
MMGDKVAPIAQLGWEEAQRAEAEAAR